jgi:hypothetical protein
MTFLKKLGCLASASAFIVCSCFPSAADELKNTNDSSSHNVTAKYSEGVVTDVYSVEIEWGSMSFEYTDETLVWNPETHEYDKQNNASWRPTASGADKVTVKNHSNKPVTVALSYTPAEGYAGITGSFGESSATIDAATEGSAYENAPSYTGTLALSGTLPSSASSSTVIGTAKVTLTTDTGGSVVDDGGGDEPDIPDTMDKSTQAGYMRLYARVTSPGYERTFPIYKQSESVYMAEISADEVMIPDANPDTQIYIGDDLYYIYEEGKGYSFMPGTTVNINMQYYDDNEGKAVRKNTAIEANRKYLLTVTLNGDGTGKATLTDITE